MSIWSLIKITIFLWLIRKTAKLMGWLLVGAIAIAAWPVSRVSPSGQNRATGVGTGENVLVSCETLAISRRMINIPAMSRNGRGRMRCHRM